MTSRETLCAYRVYIYSEWAVAMFKPRP